MAIDLPPAIPPQLTSADEIVAYASSSEPYVGKVKGYELRVTGDHYLTDGELARIFDSAETPSQAILLINSASHRKGHLLVSIRYAPDREVVHVHALQSKVATVRGAGEITPYFDDLIGDPDLKRAEFDRARVMANVRSTRSGVDYSVSYDGLETDPGNLTMVFEAKPREAHDNTDVTLQLGNQGSRFVGRYFGDAGITHDFSNGTQFGVAYQTAITEWGESRQGDDYQQFQVNLDHPFTTGLYGINASYLEYTQEIPASTATTTACAFPDPFNPGECLISGGSSTASTEPVDLDAEVSRIGLNGEQVISSDVNRRFTVYEHIEYVDSVIEDSRTGEKAQDEVYTTLELGAKYHRINNFDGKALKWNIVGSLKGGVTGDDGTLGTYDEFRSEFMNNNPGAEVPTVVPAARTAEFILFKPRATADLELDDNDKLRFQFAAQIADEQLPQQQQWVLGGINQLSAYLPGVLVGDTGYYTRGAYEHAWRGDTVKLTFSLFAEYGTSQFENASGAAGDTFAIGDAGIGLTAEVGDTLEIRAVAAESFEEKNLSDEFLDRVEADFFVTVKAVF